VSFWLGRDDQVIEVGTRVAERASDPTLATRLWIHVLRAAGRSGRHELALAVVDRAAAAGPPPPWNARLTAWSAVLLTQLGRTDEGRAAGRRALADALRFGDPLAVAYGHHSVAYGADLETAVEHTAQAIAVLGTDPESMELRMVLTCNRLIWLAQLSRMDAYQAELPRALILAERMGTFRASGVLAAAAEVDYLLGDWDGVLVHLAGVDPEFAAHCGNVRLHGLAALIALHRGEREQARAHFAAIDQVAGAPYTQPGLQAAYLRTARALLAEADGDLDGALTFAASWIDVPPGVRRSERVDEAPHTVRLALAKGDLALARAATAAIRADALAEPLPGRVAAVRLCQAQLDDDLDALLAVAEVFRGYGWPLQAGHALEEAAVRAASRGDTTRARAVLTEAVRGYSAIGAAWDVRRADSRLRAFGVRRGPRSVHRRESCGWGALTPSELQIAQLVATGMSNPDIADELFLSRRTVQAHVSNILGKLGLTSRVEVGRIAADVADAADVVGAVTVGAVTVGAGVGARVPRPRKR
jgi:DNA-binding CsgD family transcriptional regulator